MQQLLTGFENLTNSNHTNKKLRLKRLKNDSQDIHEWFNKFERQTFSWEDEERGIKILISNGNEFG